MSNSAGPKSCCPAKPAWSQTTLATDPSARNWTISILSSMTMQLCHKPMQIRGQKIPLNLAVMVFWPHSRVTLVYAVMSRRQKSSKDWYFMAIVGQTQTYGHRMEVGHGSHLVILLSNVLVTKLWKNGSHLALEQMSLFFNQTRLLILFFFMCLRQTVTKKKEGEGSRGNHRSLPHIPRQGSRVESTAELWGAGRLESL